MATEYQKQIAWENTKTIRGMNPNLYRRDRFGYQIYKPAYGTHGAQGWEVDHSHPKALAGTDSPRNLQAMQTAANRTKGKRYPY